MRVTTAWFQKHPSPSRSDWGFHWHGDDDGQAAEVLEHWTRGRLRHPFGLLWWRQGQLWWLRSFRGRAPSEQRHYTGVVAHAMPGLSWRDAAAKAPVGPATPWRGDGAVPEPADESDVQRAHVQLARALAGAGTATPEDSPHAFGWPVFLADFESWLPDLEDRLARGVCVAGGDPTTSAPGVSSMRHYLERVTYGSTPWPLRARAWQLVRDIAARGDRELSAVFAELVELAGAWERARPLWVLLRAGGPLTDDVLAVADARAPAPLWVDDIADAGWLWSRIMNYWGRDFLPEHVGPALADLLVRRIAIDHLYKLDHADGASPWRYLRRLREEALLPQQRCRAMLALVHERAPALGRPS